MTTLATATLPLHADCAAFHPARAGLLAAAGYQLDEATRTRAGSVWLFQCEDGGGDDEASGGGKLAPAGGLGGRVAGVFDAAWTPWGGSGSLTTLTLALADGRVEARALEEEEEKGGAAGGLGLRLAAAATPGGDDAAAAPPAAMALYIAHHPAVPGRTAVTLADGRVAVLAWDAAGAAVATASVFTAHSLEAWTAAWCSADPAVLYTGGDDGALAGWDVRTACAAPAWRAPRGAHGAGVTAIAPASSLVASGSYDERVRLWDVRWPAAPALTAQCGAGGGVWRLAWRDAAAPRTLLAACMHASFAVARVTDDAVTVVETYDAHGGDNLGYGAAWWVGGGRGGADVVATASFYDNSVHLWRPRTQEDGVQ